MAEEHIPEFSRPLDFPMKKNLLVAIFIFFGCGLSFAQSSMDVDSANWMMPGCRAFRPQIGIEDFHRGMCMGAIRAIVNLDLYVCPSKEVTGDQWLRVVVQYIGAMPARLHENFYKLATEALRKTWPCR